MTLNKRCFRSIKANLPFYLSASILTMITLLIVYLYYIGGTGINQFADDFFVSQELEDAHFTTYMPISDSELASLEEEFNLVLEAQQCIEVVQDDTTSRVFSINHKINLYDITKGEDIQSDQDIIISEGYALNMGVDIGDTIVLNNMEFTVTGYFQRPDYLFMLENEDDSYKNITTFYLAYVSDEAFTRLGTSQRIYYVQYLEDNEISFREALNERYYTQSYLSASENMRILMVHQQADMFIMMSEILLVLMPLIAVLLVCIVIARKVREEQQLIGTLSALGYTKNQLIGHYSMFGAIPGLFGGILSLISALIFDQTYGELCLADYEPMHITFTLPIFMGILGVIIPTLMYMAAAAYTTHRLLKNDTIALLHHQAGESSHLKTIFKKSKMKFSTKYAIRSLIGNPMRSFGITLGIFIGSLIIFVCFGMIDSIENIKSTATTSVGSFEYEYILNVLTTDEIEDGSSMLVSSFEEESGRRVSFMGIQPDNPYLELVNKQGERIEIDNGWYISSAASQTLSIDAGDTITFYHPLTLKSYTITIDDVVEYDIGSAIFTSLNNMNTLLETQEGIYNAIMSDHELDLEDSIVRQTIRKSSINDQADTILDEMGVLIYTCVVLGIIICIAAVYVVVDMMVKENSNQISMLKILGYPDNRINQIILSSNHILLPIGILLSIPTAFICLDIFWQLLLDYDAFVIKTYIQPSSYIITILFTSLCYFVSIYLVGKKTKSVDMAAALKNNRE